MVFLHTWTKQNKSFKNRKSGGESLNNTLVKKLKEAVIAILPITAIVIILNFTVASMPWGTLALFLVSAVLLIIGMGLFTLGADVSMMLMGDLIGAELSKSRKLWLFIVVCFVLGFAVTVAEPDLSVLAGQVPLIPDSTMIFTVALGVGIFLVLAALRVIFGWNLKITLLVLYAAVFIMALFVSDGFLGVAFDSGGVTTGPITVPFIMALGIGISAVRGGASSRDDSFGYIALCSVGPIIAVMALGLFYGSPSGSQSLPELAEINGAGELFRALFLSLPKYFSHVALALMPILVFFLIFQAIFLKLPKRSLAKIFVGAGYTYIGLVIFLNAVNVGFMPVGYHIGQSIAGLSYNWILIPIGALIGFFVVMAEPAVHVLTEQVESVSGGSISRNSMLMCMAIGVAVSLALSMIKSLNGLSLWWFIAPGYALAIILSFFTSDVFTAIAFDSGGVASGPMTATFLLPLSMGTVLRTGGDMMTDAFGIVAMVAMTPLITIQIMGLIYKIKLKRGANVSQEPSDEEDIVEFETESENEAEAEAWDDVEARHEAETENKA